MKNIACFVLGFILALGVGFAKPPEAMTGWDIIAQAFNPVAESCHFHEGIMVKSPKCQKAIDQYIEDSFSYFRVEE